MSKSTILNDPLEPVIPVQDISDSGPAGTPRRKREPRARGAQPVENADQPVRSHSELQQPPILPAAPKPTTTGRRKQKLTVHLDEEIVNRVKNAAYWTPRLTIARIAEAGIRKEIAEIERENGGPYKQREAELIGGRPMK